MPKIVISPNDIKFFNENNQFQAKIHVGVVERAGLQQVELIFVQDITDKNISQFISNYFSEDIPRSISYSSDTANVTNKMCSQYFKQVKDARHLKCALEVLLRGEGRSVEQVEKDLKEVTNCHSQLVNFF